MPGPARVSLWCGAGGRSHTALAVLEDSEPVMSTLIGAGSAFGDVPAATLAGLLRDAMRDLLGEPRALATDDPSLTR
jgi:hypothetical protein